MKDLSSKVASAAGRLCLAQADLSEEAAETRQAYFDEIIAKELSGLTVEERDAFLGALADRFPVPVEDRALPPAPPAADDLADRVRACSPAQRKQLLEILGVEPAEPVESAETPPELEAAASDLTKRLGVKQVEWVRVCELLGQTAALVGAFDQMAWSTWQAIAPGSALRRGENLTGAIQRYVSGDANTAFDVVRQALDTLRKLLAALSASLGHVTHHLAHEHFARIAPAEIENLIGVESGGFLTSREVKCWRKYVEISEAFTEARLEQDIKERMARYVESLMKVAGR